MPGVRNETETRIQLIDPVLHAKGWEHLIKREETLGQIIVADGLRHAKRAQARTDYTLRVPTARGQDLVIGIIEAKAESEPPGQGLDQSKKYARRLHARFVFSTNGHQFVMYDAVTGMTSEPQPVDAFPTPFEIRDRWEGAEAIDLDAELAKPLTSPYPLGESQRRGYQDGAIRAALAKIARGEKRVLLHLATGTGKTFIAANLLKKIAAGEHLGRALFLCDRDELRTQALGAMQQFFGGEAAAASATDSAKNARVIVATYQTLGFDDEESEDASFLTKHYPEDFFTHIIVDEAHRSGFGKWRQVLDRNQAAVQIGLTATPREIRNLSNLAAEDQRRFQDTTAYFGEPVFSYDLADALEDGFLAQPIIDRMRIHHNRSEDGEELLTIEPGDLEGKEVRDVLTGQKVDGIPRSYGPHDFDVKIELDDRVRAMCADLFNRLVRDYGDPEAKTIVFCASDNHASRVKDEMNNLYAQWCARHAQVRRDPYAVQITHSVRQNDLPDFRGSSRHTFIATTVDLLSTGVDIPALKNVAFFRYIQSAIQVSQMVGRGSRLDPKTNKLFFRIYDYTDATRLLGENFESAARKAKQRDDGPVLPPEDAPPPIKVQGVHIEIRSAGRFVVGEDGRRVALAEALHDLGEALRREASSLDELRDRWVPPKQRKELMRALGSAGTVAPALLHLKEMDDYDLWDFFGQTGFELDPLTKEARADELLVTPWAQDLDDRPRRVVSALMDVFRAKGTEGLEGRELFSVPAVAYAGGLPALGGADRFLEMRGVLFL
ncbi:MAG TPA: hypothetical protein DIS76_00725 [Rhodospirillaceae bacterium]|nr:hypothetical protein [Rhodospirillaceae bacterium]